MRRTKACVIECEVLHVGLPPQIKWMRYSPGQHFTQHITKEHAGLCDVFATTGAS